MSTAAVSSSSIFQELQSFYQGRQTDLKQLGSDIKSGNLSAAQQDYQALAALGQGGPFAGSEPFVNSSRAQAFNSLGDALQAGDLTGAQAAFTALTSGTKTTSASTSAAVVNLANTKPGNATTAADNTASIYVRLQAYRQQRSADLAQLGQDLKAGDLSAARKDFAALRALGRSGPNKNGQTYQNAVRSQNLHAIGHALRKGDLAAAQSAYTVLTAKFGNQHQQDQHARTAISAYNSA
jgi:hypothetical protein